MRVGSKPTEPPNLNPTPRPTDRGTFQSVGVDLPTKPLTPAASNLPASIDDHSSSTITRVSTTGSADAVGDTDGSQSGSSLSVWWIIVIVLLSMAVLVIMVVVVTRRSRQARVNGVIVDNPM